VASTRPTPKLSRRERQIMDVLYRAGKATAAAVHQALPDPPSYAAVRATLRILEEKGHVRHETEDLRYVYKPSVSRDRAKRSALRHLLHTFFDGSISQVMASLIDLSPSGLDERELQRVRRLVDEARSKGR
jgi:BlaI family transcriptional regulator, penicillinase repressor